MVASTNISLATSAARFAPMRTWQGIESCSSINFEIKEIPSLLESNPLIREKKFKISCFKAFYKQQGNMQQRTNVINDEPDFLKGKTKGIT